MIKIVHARIDENGNIVGGKQGDQTGKEVVKQDFYDDSWHTVYRAKEVAIAKHMVKGAEQIAKNDHIGYSQDRRYTMFEEAKKVNFNFDKIETDCSCDCSQMIATLIMSTGINVKKEFFTWNMDGIMNATEQFDKIPYQKGMVLKAGDIVLKTGHVVMVVESDAYDLWVGECYGVDFAPVYVKASTKSDRCSYPTLATGNLFEVRGESGNFYKIWIVGGHTGYIKKQYVLRKTPKTVGFATSKMGAVNVRANAGKDFKYLGTIEVGTKVEICDTKTGADGKPWYYIVYDKGFGFCSAEYIKVD